MKKLNTGLQRLTTPTSDYQSMLWTRVAPLKVSGDTQTSQ